MSQAEGDAYGVLKRTTLSGRHGIADAAFAAMSVMPPRWALCLYVDPNPLSVLVFLAGMRVAAERENDGAVSPPDAAGLDDLSPLPGATYFMILTASLQVEAWSELGLVERGGLFANKLRSQEGRMLTYKKYSRRTTRVFSRLTC